MTELHIPEKMTNQKIPHHLHSYHPPTSIRSSCLFYHNSLITGLPAVALASIVYSIHENGIKGGIESFSKFYHGYMARMWQNYNLNQSSIPSLKLSALEKAGNTYLSSMS